MGTHPIFESDFDCLTEMDDSENVDRLIFFEQYLIKLKSEECFLQHKNSKFTKQFF